jgi:hypothetical protein
MHEMTFDALEEGAKEEVRQLSAELGWSLEKTAQEYLEAGRTLALQRQLEQMKRSSPVIHLTEHKKGLERG